MRQVDRLAVERYRISGPVLMENAGRNAAEIIRREFPQVQAATIVCGTGNNGGDGCVIARHLHNAGWAIRLLMTGDASRMTQDTGANFAIVEAMGLDRLVSEDPDEQKRYLDAGPADAVVVDALLGTGFQGTVRPPTDQLIEWINEVESSGIVAVDVPSGLDCDGGRPSNATIRASVTVTFVARKMGFAAPGSRAYSGKVFVANIGTPPALIDVALSQTVV